jgi:hypothetical protein
MKMPTAVAMAAISLSFLSSAIAQDERPYTEGPVTIVSEIRTEPGMFDEYMRYLATTYKQLMEEYKKQGIITDWRVYAADPRTVNDPDVYLTITYKNMAALDGLADRSDPIDRKVWGSLAKADQALAERGKMRTQLGNLMIRELTLK